MNEQSQPKATSGRNWRRFAALVAGILLTSAILVVWYLFLIVASEAVHEVRFEAEASAIEPALCLDQLRRMERVLDKGDWEWAKEMVASEIKSSTLTIQVALLPCYPASESQRAAIEAVMTNMRAK